MDFIMERKRAVIAISVALILIVAGGVRFLSNLPDSVVAALIQRTVSADQTGRRFKQDALYVITTGTGAPLPDPRRAGPQAVVLAGDQLLVFDAGPGSTRHLELTGLDISSVDALFLTHYHSDHIGDLGELMLKRWATSGPSVPLPIYGPPGVEEVVAGFEAAYQLDRGYRIAHHGQEVVPPSGFGGDVHMFDLGTDLMSSDVVYERGDVQVVAFNVDHTPVFPAVGFRVTYKDRSVVISGDTIFTESLTHHAMGADVFVSEALNHKMSAMVADAARDSEGNLSTVAEDIQPYHIRPEEAAIVARDAGIPLLIFTHVLPPVPADFLINWFGADAEDIHDGEVYMASDGTLVSMPVNSERYTIDELQK